MNQTNCDECLNYEYDEDWDCYRCAVDLDEDEAERFMTGRSARCPFYRPGDEYTIVRKQI